MSATGIVPRRRGSTRTAAGAAAAALVVLGLGAWLLYRLLAGTEPHSYGLGVAPTDVELVAGHSYALAVRGGVGVEQVTGVTPKNLRCTATSARTGTTPLTVAPEATDTKAINQIGSFVAPLSGRVRVACAGLGEVFVDDASDAGTDYAGVSLLLAVALLGVGVPLALSVIRSARTRDDHEVERDVEVPVGQGEVGGADPRDVGGQLG